MNDFVIHGCEQVLRFTRAEHWGDLPESVKVQLGFNMGVVALGLNLAKEDSYTPLVNAREGKITMADLHKHVQSLISAHKVPVDEAKIARPFETIL